MDAEITEIATRGATALAGLMVTSAWDRVRPRVAALFGRRADSVSEELDEAQAELVAAREGDGESAARSVQGEWEPKLRRLLANDPAAVAELQAILDEFAPKPAERPNVVHNELKDMTVSGGIVIQAGTITARDIGS
ncbi:hypothetical protein [Streptomyces sp. CBMA156]|uniref:hypothetical protein n=1 Tax=Streptomyces sp. CBMA156 TaxID=1930280 RepID=UPI001661CE49|nr:hypothetical protein [Streptomyces sp. CBMA156]MBD0674104.1 hypothetical protein [Streptomyces sp. CBMA156]